MKVDVFVSATPHGRMVPLRDRRDPESPDDQGLVEGPNSGSVGAFPAKVDPTHYRSGGHRARRVGDPAKRRPSAAFASRDDSVCSVWMTESDFHVHSARSAAR